MSSNSPEEKVFSLTTPDLASIRPEGSLRTPRLSYKQRALRTLYTGLLILANNGPIAAPNVFAQTDPEQTNMQIVNLQTTPEEDGLGEETSPPIDDQAAIAYTQEPASIEPTLISTLEATPILKPPLVFRFGTDISDSDQQLIRHAASWTQRYWGEETAPVTVYTYSDFESLLNAFGQDCACPDWTSLWEVLRSELQSPDHFTSTVSGVRGVGRGALLILASQTGVWQRYSEYTRLQHITHSQMHSMQRGLTGGPVNPVWMAEGNADYSGSKVLAANGRLDFSTERRGIITEAKSMPYPLSQLESWSTLIPRRAPYAHGFLATEFLASRYGEASILTFWRTYGMGGNWQNAFELTYGIPVARFYSDFAAYLARL